MDAEIKLADGSELIDGMASWWCAIHGYNHPELNAAIRSQLDDMAHVMFGGLTHEPAINLAEALIEISPTALDTVFFADSGSVSVEVAMKMAIQYWSSSGKSEKQRFMTISNGYHGDTIGAMSVCDPITGMHNLFNNVIAKQIFANRPNIRFHEEWNESDIENFSSLLQENHTNIAAVILEPIVQGAGACGFIIRNICVQCVAYVMNITFY